MQHLVEGSVEALGPGSEAVGAAGEDEGEDVGDVEEDAVDVVHAVARKETRNGYPSPSWEDS
jgi:hypothetical protein